jgi:DNA-binding transcriptional MerR regulator
MSCRFFTSDDVAGKLNVSRPTLALWCTTFANRLSASANPPRIPSGSIGQRLFTEEDVAVLARARQLLDREVASSPHEGVDSA